MTMRPTPPGAMRKRTPRYAAYVSIALLFYVFIVPGCAILARVQVAGITLPAAFAATVQHALANPTPWLLGLVPFAAVAWIAGSLARRSPILGVVLMAVCLILFALLNYGGQTDAQKFLLRSDDAEATLATGVVQFRSLGVVLLAFVARLLLARSRSAAQPAPHAASGDLGAPR